MHTNSRLFSAMALLLIALPAVSGQPTVSILTPAPMSAVTPGQSVTMAVTASGSLLTYQWKLNGVEVPGATGATYTIMVAGAADRGSYDAVVTGSGGSVTVSMGSMVVAPSDARIINLSARAMAGMGSNVMITGFVSQGDANSTPKSVMLRGMGPGLSAGMGMMSGILVDPVLTVYDGHSNPMASDAGWMNAPMHATGSGASGVQANVQPAMLSMMDTMGAFRPTMGSSDSALMMTAPFGGYTAIISGANGSTGIALAECYDADAALGNASNTARLVNMSGRANVGVGANVLIAGLVIAPGPRGLPETVLLRAMGPALSGMGVDGVLEHPSMTLYDRDSKPIATNVGWGNAPVMATGSGASPVLAGIMPASAGIMGQVGATPAATGSADCAMVATLSPGNYTVIVSGMPDHAGNPTTGVVLVEVYEVK